MADYLNEDIPVSDPNSDGNYRWLAVRSGGYSGFTCPINLHGGFLFNQAGDASIMYEMVASTATAGNANWTPAVPNVAGNSLKVLSSNAKIDTFVASGANLGTFRLNYGGNTRVKIWVEIAVQSLSTAGDADEYTVGLFEANSAGNAFAGGNITEATRVSATETVVPSTQTLIKSTDRTQFALLTADNVTDNNFLCICVKNMTSAGRGLLVKYLKVIVASL